MNGARLQHGQVVRVWRDNDNGAVVVLRRAMHLLSPATVMQTSQRYTDVAAVTQEAEYAPSKVQRTCVSVMLITWRTRTSTSATLSLGVPSVPRGGRQAASRPHIV